jgi:hypothetical protein
MTWRAFSVRPSWQAVILSAADGGNVLTPAGVTALFDLEGKMRALPDWDDACLRRGTANCVYRGLTGFWCDRAHFDAEVTGTALQILLFACCVSVIECYVSVV